MRKKLLDIVESLASQDTPGTFKKVIGIKLMQHLMIYHIADSNIRRE